MTEATVPGAAIARQLCVVVPTFKERDNVPKLFAKLDAALAGISWEVIFVDDNSPDGTWDVARALAQTDPRVRCIRRIGRRGLSGACIEGILASSAPFVAVMDADLQHDETQLPKMLALLEGKKAELVVGSRYVSGGDTGNFDSTRLGGSVFATTIAKKLLHIDIADPMSGFFMIRRDRFEQLAPSLSVQGFKILLDIVATAHGKLRVIEVPYTFGERLHGESKLDSRVVLDFLGLVFAKLTRDLVSLRFLLFALVGSIGLVVHLVALYTALAFSVPFAQAQAGRRTARDDRKLPAQQSPHLPGSAPERLCRHSRPAAVLSRVQRRAPGQCRRRILRLRSGADLVARGCRRRIDGRGVELRRVEPVRLASEMTSDELKLARGAAYIVAALVVLRLVAAAFTPLTFDEAYYWTWSKHLAGGYYDHPPMVAVVIRLGTMIGGDTEFGVRLASILLVLPMSWAVYRTAEILFHDVRIAALATILLNATLMVRGRDCHRDTRRTAHGGISLCVVVSSQGAANRAWHLVACSRCSGGMRIGVEIHRAVLRRTDPAVVVAGQGHATLVRVAMALSRWSSCVCDFLSGAALECRSPLGVVHQATWPGACRGHHPQISR